MRVILCFLTCKCQLPFKNCSVDVSLADNTPVFCTLDFIESLDVVNTCQVVRGHSSGFYYIYQDNVNSVHLHKYCAKDLGPFQVVGSSLANVMFCNQTRKHRVYSTPIIPIPNFALTIVHLEMWNIVIALRMSFMASFQHTNIL